MLVAVWPFAFLRKLVIN